MEGVYHGSRVCRTTHGGVASISCQVLARHTVPDNFTSSPTPSHLLSSPLFPPLPPSHIIPLSSPLVFTKQRISPTILIMADVAVENPFRAKSEMLGQQHAENIAADKLYSEDQYTTFKKLQRELEYIKLQEEYIKDEQRSLKRELVRAQEEIKRIQSVPLVIGQFMEAIDEKYAT